MELLPTVRRREAVRAAHVRRIEAAAWLGARRATRREDAAARCAAAGEVVGSAAGVGRSAGMEVAIATAAVVAMGTGNRVLYKLALVPLRDYPFFLAQLATFGLCDGCLVLGVHLSGRITGRDFLLVNISIPVRLCAFFLVGGRARELAFQASWRLYQQHQGWLLETYLVWQLLLSAIFLKRRYRINEITGCFLVTVGVIITVASGSSAGASLKGTGILWPLLMIISFFLQAADTVLKEIIFLNAAKKLKGGSVDLFVVNSYGSAYQALFMCLLLPFLSKLWGVPFHQLPTYIRDGTACFLNMGSLSSGCEGAPLLPLLFVLVNMGFNISLLHLLKISSAVVSSLASTFSVPLSIYAFTLPLPYIGVASTLPPGFVAGAMFLDGTRTREKRRSIITTGMKSKNGGGGGSGGNTNGSHRRITAAAAINIIRTLLSILASPAAVDWTASSGRRLTGCSTLRCSSVDLWVPSLGRRGFRWSPGVRQGGHDPDKHRVMGI
ncbi:hypothetical protein [Oryza sativa Japonica Group]|uniref:Uncharacterized protein n=1 Tax=Oryza sativa subsp. japonica TaxID=39947 RepID=Q5JJT0_ORYSJ|nr:hypothetical protein [Oryza sativa Japonica Group]